MGVTCGFFGRASGPGCDLEPPWLTVADPCSGIGRGRLLGPRYEAAVPLELLDHGYLFALIENTLRPSSSWKWTKPSCTEHLKRNT